MSKPSPVRIQIKHFQSIEDLDFVVHGFTTISGPSNIGKSAILRAVSRAILNNPVVGMVRKGRKFCTVELSSDGWGFKWEKGEREVNRYTIGGKVYDKVGQAQLPQVEAMGFGSVSVGDDRVQPWLADQWGPIFLLNRPGPQVTDFVSEVSHLQTVQNAIVLAARGKKQCTDEAKEKASALADTRKQASAMAPAEALDKVHPELEQQLASIREYEDKIRAGADLLRRIDGARRSVSDLGRVRSAQVPPTDAASRALERAKAASEINADLKSRVGAVLPLRAVKDARVPEPPAADHDRLAEILSFSGIAGHRALVEAASRAGRAKVPAAPAGQGLATLSRMCAHRDGVAAARKAVKAYGDLVPVPEVKVPDPWGMRAHLGALSDARRSVFGLEEELDRAKAELNAAGSELAQIPVCPVCKRPVQAPHAGH